MMICRIPQLLPLAALLLASSSSFFEIATGFAFSPPLPLLATRRSSASPRGLAASSSSSSSRDDDGQERGAAVAVVVSSSSLDHHHLGLFSPSPHVVVDDPSSLASDVIVVETYYDDRRAASSTSTSTAVVVFAAAATFLLLTTSTPEPAYAAAGPDWGIFEGRTGSILHPIAMMSMFGLSASTALLGFQWKRQRSIGDEISSLKKSMPDLGGSSSAKEALSVVTSSTAEDVDASYVRSLRDALETEIKIEELTKERKELANTGPRDKHFNQGALLLFVGTAFAIEGPLNTYARAGKLFPGPHLYAGAGLVVLWSLAASMVPYMQKGNDVARSVHIGANLVGIGLFAWQVTTGLPILFKVVELTKWP